MSTTKDVINREPARTSILERWLVFPLVASLFILIGALLLYAGYTAIGRRWDLMSQRQLLSLAPALLFHFEGVDRAEPIAGADMRRLGLALGSAGMMLITWGLVIAWLPFVQNADGLRLGRVGRAFILVSLLSLIIGVASVFPPWLPFSISVYLTVAMLTLMAVIAPWRKRVLAAFGPGLMLAALVLLLVPMPIPAGLCIGGGIFIAGFVHVGILRYAQREGEAHAAVGCASGR